MDLRYRTRSSPVRDSSPKAHPEASDDIANNRNEMNLQVVIFRSSELLIWLAKREVEVLEQRQMRSEERRVGKEC